MSSGSERTNISVYSDHEIIVPANKLAKAVSTKLVLPGDDPVARAEEALAQLSSEFAGWMNAECDRLDAARQAVKTHGFSKDTRDELFHAPEPARIPLTLLDQHVDAVRAIVREYARPDIVDMATALNNKLHAVTYDFLVHENRHRPDYLDGVFTDPPPAGVDF
jgi:hypothetical protein